MFFRGVFFFLLGTILDANISRVELFRVAGRFPGTHPHGSSNSRSIPGAPHVDRVHV